MRLFLSLAPPSSVVEHLAAAVATVATEHPDLRWIPPERWHLTLAFYGEVADRDVARLQRRIARQVAGTPTLDLSFAEAGRFDGRVLWVGVAGDTEALRVLGRQVSVENRKFRPHLTVARGRGGVDLEPAVALLRPYAGPTWRADAVHLVRSHLGPNPRYDDLAQWPLGAPA